MRATVNSTYVDLSGLEERVVEAVFQEMEGISEEILIDTKRLWSGWKYKGRPATARRNVSQRAWSISVDRDGERAVIALRNNAVDWRAEYYASKGKGDLAAKYRNRPYVYAPKGNPPIWVSRRKMGTPELFKVFDMILHKHTPELEKRIAQRIVEEVRTAPKTSKKASRFSGVKRVIAKLLSPFRRS